jgi:PKD repeat protein
MPLTVAFTGTASGGIPPYTYAWSFGDGSQAATQNASHTYPAEGAFPVSFTVRDSASGTATDDHLTIYVGSDFQATASGQPSSGPAPLTVQFGATASGGSPPYAYAWDFGDGSTSTLQSPSHTYGADGEYGVLLTAQDSIGRTATDSGLLVRVGSSPGTPAITGVAKATDPFRLKVSGEGFLVGCTVLIEGQSAPSTVYKSGGLVVAKGGSSLKALLPKGAPVCVTVKNPSGIESACWTFVR